MIVASDYVTVHMVFTGHFTGRLGETLGKGQAVTFVATDLLKVENGRITDNLHIEDNQTLLQEDRRREGLLLSHSAFGATSHATVRLERERDRPEN